MTMKLGKYIALLSVALPLLSVSLSTDSTEAWAQTPPANAPQTFTAETPASATQIMSVAKPDVQIVVMQMPYTLGTWGVTMVYPKKVSRAEAEQRYKELLRLTGWKGTDFQWEERGFERAANVEGVPQETTKGLEPVPIMSSLTFQTTGNVVDVADGTMPIESLTRAFRDLNRVHVTFLLPATFTFRGVRHFQDNNLDLEVSGQQGTWTYVANIKNHRLEALNLPRYELVKTDANLQQAKAAQLNQLKQRRRLIGTGAVVLLAAATGMFVWLWTRR
jgi:hypothetical protein